jgi:hypothetical protein
MAKTPDAPAAAGKADPNWRHFPTIEKLFESGTLPAFLQQAEATCRQLDELIDSDSPRDAARARAAMAGYGKALEVLQELRGLAEAEQENQDT